MKYSETLKKLFPGVKLNAEDLLLLESFQVKNLPDRVPGKEFATLLRAHPSVVRFLKLKYPPIEEFINSTLKKHKAISNEKTIEEHCQELLWEIAELIVYNKFPEVYDKQAELTWHLNEITPGASLRGKIVIDAGAGTGRLAFMTAPYAKTVFALEPVSSFRRFIRDKAKKENITNVFTMDGFLDSVPLPDNSADFLMTSNAIGWNLEDELKEIERVLKPNGQAIHLLLDPGGKSENPLHKILTSSPWQYSLEEFDYDNTMKLKYSKTVKK
jgi:ubiquinone/menaquinone biosynthesis C-methylase UbiE